MSECSTTLTGEVAFRLLRDLHSQGVAHLAVRVRDSVGLVGPLVIPGVTSCLGNH